jgi:prepilin-type N-terminal cleavage/methylation domain-containing protein
MPKNKNGYSLIELLLVLVLIGTIAAMTVSFTMHNKYRWALRDIARTITSTYYQAKQRAARENSSIRLDVKATGYTLYRDNAGTWQVLKNEGYYEKVSASSIANFIINPSGFIIDPGTLKIAAAQTITLNVPHGVDVDSMTITIYPYGGLNVKKIFK